jgi:pimeloyl-ACP methyl ester carboxylesterase
MSPIPFFELSPNARFSPTLHFAHANGYPPQAYAPLFERLSERFYVCAMEMKPLWEGSDSRGLKDWGDFVGELIIFLESAPLAGSGNNPIVGVGHSLGGTVTLMAAIQRPELFRALILIDPPFFPPGASLIWNVIYQFGLAYLLHPLVKGAIKRRNAFDNREAMFAHYRQKKVFEKIDDRGLWAYVDAIAKPSANGALELRYSPAWEARVYVTGVLRDWKTWRELRGFRLPVLLLRPEYYPATPDRTTQLFQQIAPQTVVRTITNTTHLAPLEKPNVISEMIFEFLNK